MTPSKLEAARNRTVNVPIDRQIHSWTPVTLPLGWEAIRDRWEFHHATRTFAALAGLACLFGSVLATSAALSEPQASVQTR